MSWVATNGLQYTIKGKPTIKVSWQNKAALLIAFVTPWGLYQWNRIPFGLMNAPTAFQRCMNECLDGSRDNICIRCQNDILVYSKSFEEHVHDVQQVLLRLQEHWIKLKPPKSKFFQRQARYLGRIVSGDGHCLDYNLAKQKPGAVGDACANF